MFALLWPIYLVLGLYLILFNKRLVERYVEKRPEEANSIQARYGRFLSISVGGFVVIYSIKEFLEHPTAIPELLGF